MTSEEEDLTYLCCFFIILAAGLYLLWCYFGSHLIVAIGAIIGIIIVVSIYSSREAKKIREEEERKKFLDALEKRLKEEQFEKEQQAKGLVKYVDKKGNIRWGTPEQVAEWARADKAQVEVIVQREIVKIRCPYCGKLYDEHLDTCPYCGASR